MVKKQIIYVEDNLADVMLFEEAIDRAELPVELVIVDDPEVLVKFLRGERHSKEFKIPDIVITDVNMSKIGGAELIRYLKLHRDFSQIPILAYSTSNYSKDVQECLDSGADEYFVKKMSFRETEALLKDIYDRWLK